MNAWISSSLVTDTRIPDRARDRLSISVTDLEEIQTPIEDDQGVVVDVVVHAKPRTRSIECECRLRGGLWLYPRATFTPAELRELGYTVTVDRPTFPPMLDLRACGDRIEPRDAVQESALNALDESDGGFLVLIPGKGKTVLSLKQASKWGAPTLVFLHNGMLYKQWQERVEEHLGVSPGLCRGPFRTWKWRKNSVVLVMLKSFYEQVEKGKVPAAFFDRFGTIIFDEAHHTTARTYQTALALFRGRRLALTATPERKGYEQMLYLHLGGVAYEHLTPDLVPKCYFIGVELEKEANMNERDSRTYARMMSHCLGGPRRRPDAEYLVRASNLLDRLRKEGRVVLMIADRKRFGESLKEFHPEMAHITQKVKIQRRMRVLKSADLIVVTREIGEEGLDRADIDAMVMAFPVGKQARSRAQQGAGRALRQADDKPVPEVYLLYPANRYGYNLARANAKHFEELGYEIVKAPRRPRRNRSTKKKKRRRR